MRKQTAKKAQPIKAAQNSGSESEDTPIKTTQKITKPVKIEVRQGRSLSKTRSHQKIVASKSVDQKIKPKKNASASDSEDNSGIAYKANTFLAFIYNDDGNQALALAKVLKESLSTEPQISAQLYSQGGKDATAFVQVEGSLMIPDWSVIFSVDLAKGTAQTKTVSISKKTHTQVAKLMDNMVDSVRAKYEELESSHNATESENEDSEQESAPKFIKRKIVKAKRTLQTQPSKASKPKQSAPDAKSIAENEESEEGSEGDYVMIDTKKAAAASAKLQDIKIGVKRKQSATETSMTQPAGRKVKKLEGGAEENVIVPGEKIKKTAKMPVVFKKGKWNPDTQVLEKKDEIERCGPSNQPIYNCCVRCNTRNLIRAVETKNYGLFKSLVYDLKNIPSLFEPWSDDTNVLPFSLIMEKGDTKMMEIFVDIQGLKKSELHSKDDQIREFYLTNRVKAKQFLLKTINTGTVNFKAYGANIRSVAMTRGNRQGNQAFLPKELSFSYIPSNYFTSHLGEYQTASIEILKACLLLFGMSMDQLAQQTWSVAMSGNKEFLIWVVEFCQKSDGFGFNKLHLDVLKLSCLSEKYHTASITKKAGSCGNCTPLHFAALNPNKNVLQALLEQNNDFNVMATGNVKPIHFAAKCEKSGPLELLIDKGASIYDQTTEKKNALHFAAMAGRADNIKVLLAISGPTLLKVRDKTNMSSMAYACKLGEIEPIKVFLEHSSGKVKISQGQGPDRLTPLHWAAQAGKYELAEWLLDNKARVLAKDKYKRTPLILAVKNGHTKLASLLLRYGSEWNHQDSSNNTPLHYAAGAGFIECIELLIKHGADVNAPNNWKTTPITIAMLLNHQGTVKRLLEEESVDVNGKDENGKTLLSMLMADLTDASCVDFAKFLLQKGANPNINDLDGNTALHMLAGYKSKIMDQVSQWKPEENNEKIRKNQKEELVTLEKMIELMIQHGSNLSASNEKKQTPFDLALEQNNVKCLKQLSKHVKLSENPELLHTFKTKIFDDRYKQILLDLINKGGFTKEHINCFDKTGYTPFLAYIEEYSSGIKSGSFAELIRGAINRAFSKLKDVSKIKISNEDLYVFEQEQLRGGRAKKKTMKFAAMRAPVKRAAFGQDSEEQETGDLPEENLKPLVQTYLQSLITEPFIALLKLVVSKGANPHTKVDKNEFYRDLDEHKRRLAMVGEAREGLFLVNTKPETVKTRKEVLAEQKVEKQGKKKNEKGEKSKIDKKLKEFYATKGYQAVFEKRGGKLVEVEYNKEVGLQNAVHLCMKTNAQQLFKYLVDDLKVAVDEIDYKGRNPFMLYAQAHPTQTEITVPQDKLLSMKVKFDLADSNGRTPFLTYYEHSNYDLAYKLLQQGANILQMDNSGLFALKYALIRRENKEIEKLVELKADINQIDTKGRNLLHHAVNMSSATADATFETEQLLIDLGININLRDQRGRVPLHYAFVKLKGWYLTQQIDPIETVSSLCGQKGLEIEVADQWLKTPLHYAAQRGAAICTLYILQRGSHLEAKDIYGNTALGICLLKKHFNYGIILIQKSADVTAKVYDEFPKRLAKKWKDEQEAAKKALKNAGDADMEGESEEEEVVETGRDLFKNKVSMHNPMINLPYGSEDDSYGSESEDENDEAINEKHEQNVFNNQNAFGMSVFKQPAAKTTYKSQISMPAQSNETGVEKETEPKSMFRVAIENQQQGIAYLILDNGFDYMNAMQDALDEKKFQLMLTLLSKTSDDQVVQQKNDKNQNLMHILAQNSSGGQFTHLKRIYDTLKRRGVKCLERDNFQNNALHYAVKSNCFELCDILIKEGINVNQVSNLGHSPLSMLLQGTKVKGEVLKPESDISRHMFTLLAQNRADMNVCYPESTFGETYKCSIIINFIRQAGCTADLKLLISNLKCLIDCGARFDVIDSLGRDAMMYAVMQNQTPLVQFIITNLTKGLLINLQDSDGKTALHFVVNPVGYGSFENTDILQLLHSSGQGYRLDIKDSTGQEPLDYAISQQSGKLAQELQKMLKRSNSKRRTMHQIESYLPLAQWPKIKFSFAEDSAQFLEEAESKRAKEIDDDKSYVPTDLAVKSEKQYKVYFDKEGRPWDAYLAKVDLKNGLYGDYVFYKIQLLHDTNRDLYVVLTRYGRIGEEGMNQRSPFPDIEDAKKEFATIFKQKSSNEWEAALTNFVKQPKKYNLVLVHYSNIKHQDYLAPFDYDNCHKSTYLEKHVKQMVEEISNVTMYQRAIQQVGINQDLMPVSALRKETLQAAKEKLSEIKMLIDRWVEMKSLGMKADFDEAQRIQDQLADLSSQYYELIPLSENKDQITRPIRDFQDLQQQFQKLDTLTQVEFSSRILIGALFRQMQINPIEYVYESLSTRINQLQVGDGEHDLIQKYIMNSYDANMKFKQLRIFKLQRKGEGERFEGLKHLENRRMLFHGSAMTNMLGILAQGLRIAPREAPSTGYMFGKGIYLADTFKKSSSYTQGHETRLMFLCEVALGNMLKLYNSHFVENLPTKYHSVMGCGANGPQYERQTLLTPEGVQVPIGQHIAYEQPSESEISNSWAELGIDKPIPQNNQFGGFGRNQQVQSRWILQQNEFIVYNTDQVRIRYLIQFQI